MNSIGTTPILAEAILGEMPKLKITRLFSTGNYEHAKYEVEITLPNGGMGQALIAIDQALFALSPSAKPHEDETQHYYLSLQGTDAYQPWHQTQIDLYIKWQADEIAAAKVLDFYSKPNPMLNNDPSDLPDPSDQSDPSNFLSSTTAR